MSELSISESQCCKAVQCKERAKLDIPILVDKILCRKTESRHDERNIIWQKRQYTPHTICESYVLAALL